MGSFFTVFLMLVAAWLAANLLHGLWVASRRHLWEKRFAREADGLLPDASAYQIGDGTVALLFIHGFADTPYLWRRVAQRLAAKGMFTCRAMRLPGSSEPASTAKHQSLALWRTQVTEELTQLCATHSAVWIVGHSLGGALALDAALRSPGQVDGVAVIAPLIQVSRKRCPLLPPRVWFNFARAALCLSPTFESPFSGIGVAGDDPSFTYVRDRFIPFSAYRALFQLTRLNRHQAAHLACPVFAVLAGRDSVVDSAVARRWLVDCPEPKELRELPDNGHVIPLAPGWEALFDDLADFVRKHSMP